MKPFHILIVEDDQSIRNLIATTLKVSGYTYSMAANAAKVIHMSLSDKPDLILLDLGLPDRDGMEVIESVRSWSNMPILVISARGDDADKIHALDAGADDYLTKPFSTEELLARIRVSQRRLSYIQDTGPYSHVFTNGDLTIDWKATEVMRGGQKIHLTATEYRLLKLLAFHVGKVLTYSMITREIWGGTIESDIVSLRVHMATIRRKLGDTGSESPLIKTHVGIGYSMNKY